MTPFVSVPILQHAWVVSDLAEAARRWHTAFGIGPFLVNRHIRLDAPRHRGVPTVTNFSTAIAQSGDIQIELVEQHDDSDFAFRDTVAAGVTAFHHVAIMPTDYDAALAHYRSLGYAVAADGRFGDMRFCYVDTYREFGHMLELVEDKPGIRAFFGAVRRAAAQWDGDPATLLQELV